MTGPIQNQRPKMRRADRKARRAEAQRVIRHLGDLVVRHRVNDRQGAHVMLWLTERRRVEWWPGACHRHDAEAGSMRGTAADLVAFLRRQQPAKRRSPRFMEVRP